MNQRAVEIAGFLAQKGWDDAQAAPMAADLSPRRYARLENSDGRRAILMDADADQNTMQFVALAKVLRGCGITAPEIFAADPPHGFVLMEDFGERNFGRMIDSGAEALPLYCRAVDVLVQLHSRFDKAMTADIDLPVFNATRFIDQMTPFLEVYIPSIKNHEATLEETESFRDVWLGVLKNVEALPQTLMLRDFMPDNLMDVAGREGLGATGVLDFQDSGYGPIAYDIASLCEKVRRDGGDVLLDDMIAYYHKKAKPNASISEIKTACHILSAQRNTRILGTVTRLVAQTGRRDKLDWFPRIRGYIAVMLQDEALKPVREWMDKNSALS